MTRHPWDNRLFWHAILHFFPVMLESRESIPTIVVEETGRAVSAQIGHDSRCRARLRIGLAGNRLAKSGRCHRKPCSEKGWQGAWRWRQSSAHLSPFLAASDVCFAPTVDVECCRPNSSKQTLGGPANALSMTWPHLVPWARGPTRRNSNVKGRLCPVNGS